jgi:hypothetical protein
MAVAVFGSTTQFFDNSGDVLNGGTVEYYEAETTTPLTLFLNDDLTGAATNPAPLNSAGRHTQGVLYFAAIPYKAVIKNSGGSTLYTLDNLDPGVGIGSGALPIANGGTGATSAGAARTNLGVPAQSELDDLAADVAELTTSLSSIVSAPQGRLTLTTGVPVLASGVTAGTSVYYTPFVGNQIPIHASGSFVITTFAELTMALNSNHVASTIYDQFVINDSGTIRLVTGPAWNTSTAGSGSRGTGAGTTELELFNGILVNKNAVTARYGATTVAVGARNGTYVGSIFIDGSNGQLTCHTVAGQSRKWGVWNAYSQKRIALSVVDPAASWNYTSATERPLNNLTTNSLSIFTGLVDGPARMRYTQTAACTSTGNPAIGIGFNSTTASSGKKGSTAANAVPMEMQAEYITVPAIGVHVVTALESDANATGTVTYTGTAAGMLLSAEWLG